MRYLIAMNIIKKIIYSKCFYLENMLETLLLTAKGFWDTRQMVQNNG